MRDSYVLLLVIVTRDKSAAGSRCSQLIKMPMWGVVMEKLRHAPFDGHTSIMMINLSKYYIAIFPYEYN